jgi:hypothetical protein
MTTSVTLLHPDLSPLVDALLQAQQWSWEQVHRGDARLGGKPVTLDDIQWFLINSDPVLWSECNLVNRPEDGGGFWSFWPYQKASARYRGHVVHMDGAEVGKTREIVALNLWCCVAICKGSCLIGSNRDGDLDEIWEEMEFQLAQNPWLASQKLKATLKPYRKITFANGLRILLRPAGFDGSAYRGVHVGGLACHDEAAKPKNAQCFSEFWRAGKPSCEFRLYSVHDGDRRSVYGELCDRATPAELVLGDDSPEALVDQILGRSRLKLGAGRSLPKHLGGRAFVRFHWPKTIMPAPFWSESRRLEFIDLFGGADTPGYVHNVLGLPGDPESSVFPWAVLQPLVRSIPDYSTVSLRWDSHANRLDLQASTVNPLFELSRDELGESEDEDGSSGACVPMRVVVRESLDVSDWSSFGPGEKAEALGALLRAAVQPLEGDLVAGIDVGSSSITEILVARVSRRDRRRLSLVLLLQLSHVGWHAARHINGSR